MEILKLNNCLLESNTNRLFSDIVGKIIKFLEEGKVLVFPTDTVYGLVGDAANEESVNKIFKKKNRQLDKALPVFVSDLKMAKKLAEISPKQEEFLKKVWPGKVTVVLRKKSGEGTIGLRIPGYPLLNKVLEKSKLPLTGTSANISGQLASTKIKEVLSQFKSKNHLPDVVVDVGDLKESFPSTVVDLTKNPPRILRRGAVEAKWTF